MPVIGRLDSQVNDVLIEPVGGRRPRDGRDERDSRATNDERGPRATNDERGPRSANDAAPHAPTGETARGDARDGGGARRGEQLPVWLL